MEMLNLFASNDEHYIELSSFTVNWAKWVL